MAKQAISPLIFWVLQSDLFSRRLVQTVYYCCSLQVQFASCLHGDMLTSLGWEQMVFQFFCEKTVIKNQECVTRAMAQS